MEASSNSPEAGKLLGGTGAADAAGLGSGKGAAGGLIKVDG